MLNRSIAHICGHVETHSYEPSMFGRVSRKEIDRRLNELAQQPCKNCMNSDRGDVSGANVVSDDRTTLLDIRIKAKKIGKESEDARYRRPKDVAIAISVEASELLEHFQWLSDKESGDTMGSAEKNAKLGADLADIIIYCLIFADALKIDVAKAIEEKVSLVPPQAPANPDKGDYMNLSNL